MSVMHHVVRSLGNSVGVGDLGVAAQRAGGGVGSASLVPMQTLGNAEAEILKG